MFDLNTAHLSSEIAAIGALGTAAFGLTDSLKTLPSGGLSDTGFVFIQRALQKFFVGATRRHSNGEVKSLFDTLHGNWINGRALTDQKSIAKSLIKLHLNSATTQQFATSTGVDAALLLQVATKMSHGDGLSTDELNVLGRFDLALTAILDDAYQHADQRYRNFSKLAAMVIAILLAIVGGMSYSDASLTAFFATGEVWKAMLCGLLATPLAPMTKDLASALSAGVKVAQSITDRR